MVLKYDASATYLATASRITHSVVPHVVVRKEFWLFFGFHCCINAAFRRGMIPDADVGKSLWCLDWKIVSIISGITTFFEVFYTMSSYSRYMHMYNEVGHMLDDVASFGFTVTLYLGDCPDGYMRMASRYCLSSVIIFLYSVHGTPSPEVWKQLVDRGLLKQEEREYLDKFTTMQRSFLLLSLCSKIVKAGKDKTEEKVAFRQMSGKLLKVGKHQQEILDTLAMPMPFQYFHILNVMITMNLTMWAYIMAIAESNFAFFAYFFAATIFMGLMELATQLSDPFGDDDTDFDIQLWIEEMIESTVDLIEDNVMTAPPTPHEKIQASQLQNSSARSGRENGDFSSVNGTDGIARIRRHKSRCEQEKTIYANSLATELPLRRRQYAYIADTNYREEPVSSTHHCCARCWLSCWFYCCMCQPSRQGDLAAYTSFPLTANEVAI